MAEILIKGIEMPKDKPLNLSIYPNGEVVLFCIQGRDVYDNECNYGDYKHKKIAVELPEPHGRLGDLDKTRKQIEDSIETVAKSKGFVDGGDLWEIVNKCFDEAPTILEASK